MSFGSTTWFLFFQIITKMFISIPNRFLINFFIFSVTEDLLARVAALELSGGAPKAAAPAAAPSKKVEKVEEDDDDEEVDLFGSDSDSEDDAEKARVREERLAAYHAKKAKKPALIAKTSVVLDIKPWDDETDMDAMLKNVKTIVKEGLLWGACKFYVYLFLIIRGESICLVC